jgi:hypothetical protein
MSTGSTEATQARSSTLAQRLQDLFRACGVDFSHDKGNSNIDYESVLMDRLETWLGMSSSSMDLSDTMEDVAPLSPSIYPLLQGILIESWDPVTTTGISTSESSGSGRLLLHSNLLLEHERQHQTPPIEMSLYKSMSAVRVTRWIRFWMELNVMGSGGGFGPSETTCTLSHLLLPFHPPHQPQSQEQPHASQGPKQTLPAFRLIQALYHHVECLPLLQGQIYLYTKSLTRNMGNAPSSASAASVGGLTPHAVSQRLQQYQQQQAVIARLNAEWEEHVQRLEFILCEWYRVSSPPLRKVCRVQLGRIWSQFLVRNSAGGAIAGGSSGTNIKLENTTSSGIDMALRVLLRIVRGMMPSSNISDDYDDDPSMLNNDASSAAQLSQQTSICYEHLLFHHLLPLHTPNSFVLWRDQTSVLELYHEPLVQCIATILQKQTSKKVRDKWIGKVLLALQDSSIWGSNKTSSGGGNTPKLVLLLHEMDTYLSLLSAETIQGSNKRSINKTSIQQDFEDFDVTILLPLLHTLGRCASSDHSRLAERALTFFQNKSLVTWVLRKDVFDQSLRSILPYIVAATPSWNPTVRKMTHSVLTTLQKTHPERFEEVCEQLFPSDSENGFLPPAGPSTIVADATATSRTSTSSALQSHRRPGTAQFGRSSISESSNSISTTDFTLKAGMGDWKPPLGGGSRGAEKRGTSMSSSIVSPSMPPPHNRGATDATASPVQPPLSVTGVAPWAMSGNGNSNKVIKGVHRSIGGGVAPWANTQQTTSSPKGKDNTSHSTIGRGKAPWANSSSDLGDKGSTASDPPLTITGVAPWAMQNSSRIKSTGTSVNPPLTVTGVAPWALANNTISKQAPRIPQEQFSAAQEEMTRTRTRSPSGGPGTRSLVGTGNGMYNLIVHVEEDEKAVEQSNFLDCSVSKPKNRVLQFMQEIAPPKEQIGASSWSKAQMSETPTLLPKLKFHDLVFGHDLGHGK